MAESKDNSSLSGIQIDGEKLDDVEKGGDSKKKVPRKIIYFQDGDTLEEYSTDEEEEEPEDQLDIAMKTMSTVDWSSMGWAAYIANLGIFGVIRTLKTFEHAGEVISYKLGITAPKYQSEINEAERLEEEELEAEKKAKVDEESWKNVDRNNEPTLQTPNRVFSPPPGMILSPPGASSTPYH